MIGPGAAFAQARLQAAFAALPSEADWLQLRGARSLAAYLEEARHGPLRPWVRGFSAQSDAHAIERGLRALYVEEVERVVEQVPQPWQSAVRCWRWLPFLPLLSRARPGGEVPDWVCADALLASLLGDLLGADGQGYGGRGDECALHPLAQQLADDADGLALKAVWLEQWQQALATLSNRAQGAIAELGTRLQQHWLAFEGLESEPAWRLRLDLREALRRDFHRQSAEPKVAFLYLLLLALDLERLRRALLDRALFAGWVETHEPAARAGHHQPPTRPRRGRREAA